MTNPWTTAGATLGFEVVSPYGLRSGDKMHEFLAYLPHFGGKRGLLVGATYPPDFAIDQAQARAAELEGFAWSFINVEAYRQFDRALFEEALRDWGYTGPPELRPSWL